MKKLFLTLVTLFTAAPLVLAASNCATRVDKNLDKSTTEKVEKCLNEEPDPEEEGPVTEVLISDTYSVQFPRPKEEQAAKQQPRQQNFRRYTAEPVAMTYTDQQHYHRFRNDIMPSSSDEQAHETAREAFKQQRGTAPAKPKGAKNVKPSRTVKAKPAQKPANKPAAKPAQQPAQPNPQVAQAQALQNDPLATNPTQDGTVPNGFLDDSVLGPSGFGYNDTDPAFQP